MRRALIILFAVGNLTHPVFASLDHPLCYAKRVKNFSSNPLSACGEWVDQRKRSRGESPLAAFIFYPLYRYSFYRFRQRRFGAGDR